MNHTPGTPVAVTAAQAPPWEGILPLLSGRYKLSLQQPPLLELYLCETCLKQIMARETALCCACSKIVALSERICLLCA